MAYGAIPTPDIGDRHLPQISYHLPNYGLHVFPTSREKTSKELQQAAYEVYAAEIEAGNTYPAEEAPSLDTFLNYFFAATVVLGVIVPLEKAHPEGEVPKDKEITLEDARAGREWKDILAGLYYVKPNYPGRSSHLCNAGFLVSHTIRGQRIGAHLGKSYLTIGPLLGYRGSVFNLVYTSNQASLKIWDNLGFTRAGLIPEAGRLKQKDGSEAYVDAVVFYKKFDPPQQ